MGKSELLGMTSFFGESRTSAASLGDLEGDPLRVQKRGKRRFV